MSNDDAGAIIGKGGSNVDRIIEMTGARISVGGLVDYRRVRMVDLWGEKKQVEEAAKMIKKLIKK